MERRKRVRREVQLPLEIIRIDHLPQTLQSTTRNISSGGGVCFGLEQPIRESAAVEYVVTLSAGSESPVRILCEGRVLRCRKRQTLQGTPWLEIAVSMARYRFLTGDPVRKTASQASLLPTIAAAGNANSLTFLVT